MAARIGVLSCYSLFPSCPTACCGREERKQATESGALPAVANHALAGVGPGDVGELALEGGGGGPAVQPFHLGGGRGQRGVRRLRRATDQEGAAGDILEQRRDAAVGIEIM